jgi:hypothetical protein
MTKEQQTLLAERYPEIFAAIKAANIGIRASVEMQIDPTLLGNIARLWQVETKRTVGFACDTHYEYHLTFAYDSVNVCLYSMIPKQ